MLLSALPSKIKLQFMGYRRKLGYTKYSYKCLILLIYVMCVCGGGGGGKASRCFNGSKGERGENLDTKLQICSPPPPPLHAHKKNTKPLSTPAQLTLTVWYFIGILYLACRLRVKIISDRILKKETN